MMSRGLGWMQHFLLDAVLLFVGNVVARITTHPGTTPTERDEFLAEIHQRLDAAIRANEKTIT